MDILPPELFDLVTEFSDGRSRLGGYADDCRDGAGGPMGGGRP